jgi:hypothetical protein
MQDDEGSYHTVVQTGHEKLQWPRALMAPGVSLTRAYQGHFARSAASSTIEALMLGLRERGTRALKEAPVQRRLTALSEAQLHEVARRLERSKSEIARAWTADEVVQLVEAWAACHGR